MKRYLVIAVAFFLAVAVAAPAMALEVKYGGLFRARVLSQANFSNPELGLAGLSYPPIFKNYWEHNNRFDQRIRIFMDFVSSENLKLVTKFEANSVWGAWGQTGTNGRSNIAGGGNIGADVNNFGVKNAYIDFKVPTMKEINFKVGVQGINLMDSWVVDDDFSAAMMEANLKPFKITLGYIAGQNWDTKTESENIDDLVLAVQWADGPFKAGILGFWQYAHNTPASVLPSTTYATPIHANVSSGPFANPFFAPFSSGAYSYPSLVVERNNLIDLGLNLGYKIDYLSAYINFIKNLGSAKIGPNSNLLTTQDYTGWMFDAGVNYFCAPFSWNLGGFYTSGKNFDQDKDNKQITISGDNMSYFAYPLGTSKYFSEIIGGGILDNDAPNYNGGYWRGYPYPTNIWTVTLGGGWQVLPDTKLSASYWYFSTSASVPSYYDDLGRVSTSSNLGHEFDVYVTQRIVDKLNLDLVGAYMITGDAYRAKFTNNPVGGDDGSVYELGARLQWAF